MKASFSHFLLSDFEGSLARNFCFYILWLSVCERKVARKLRFHIFIFNCQFLRDVSHERFFFTSSTFSFWGASRTKAHFYMRENFVFTSTFYVFVGCLARKLRFDIFSCQFLRDASCKNFVFKSSTFSFWGKTRTKTSFWRLHFSVFDGGLARNFSFHIFNLQCWNEVSHESFVFASWNCSSVADLSWLWRRWCSFYICF